MKKSIKSKKIIRGKIILRGNLLDMSVGTVNFPFEIKIVEKEHGKKIELYLTKLLKN